MVAQIIHILRLLIVLASRHRSLVLENLALRQQQAVNNAKEQFGQSPNLTREMENAFMDALDAHTTMSKQALNSATVREGIKDILLNYAGLWEALRERAATSEVQSSERS